MKIKPILFVIAVAGLPVLANAAVDVQISQGVGTDGTVNADAASGGTINFMSAIDNPRAANALGTDANNDLYTLNMNVSQNGSGSGGGRVEFDFQLVSGNAAFNSSTINKGGALENLVISWLDSNGDVLSTAAAGNNTGVDVATGNLPLGSIVTLVAEWSGFAINNTPGTPGFTKPFTVADVDFQVESVSAVPLPASALLFMSALGGLGLVSRRRAAA